MTVTSVATGAAKAATHPHKSTTHEEMFFHITEPIHGYRGATVFFRKDTDGYWYGSASFCSMKDMFNRRIGRCQARRRYFRDGFFESASKTERPKYEHAEKLAAFEAASIQEQAHGKL